MSLHIGFVILNYNSFEDTINCVNNLSLQMKDEDEVLIIDNFSTDNSYYHLSNAINSKNVKIIKTNCNLGYAKGNNIGIQYYLELGAKYICICNPDTVVKEKSIQNLTDYLEENEGICAVGPLIRGQFGNIMKDCAKGKLGVIQKIFVTTPLRKFDYFGINSKFYYNYKYDKPLEVFQLSGSFIMFRREVLDAVRGFDPNTFLYQEESILFSKIHDMKLGKVVMLPTSEITHNQEGRKFNSYLVKHFIFSEQYYLKNILKTGTVFRMLMFSIRWMQILIRGQK